MGLSVERIMAEVEEEMLHRDEELLRMNGEPAEVEHMDGELDEDLSLIHISEPTRPY